MTGRELVKALEKRKELIKPFLVECLVESDIISGETVTIEKEVIKEVVKELSTEQETKLNEKIAELETDLKAEQTKIKELAKTNADLIKKANDAPPELDPWVVLNKVDYITVTKDRDLKTKPTQFLTASGEWISIDNKEQFAEMEKEIKLSIDQFKKIFFYKKLSKEKDVTINTIFATKTIFTVE